ncbi:MAG TPA: hypothetical protein VNE63_05400 [Candidatus Acidoferrales bacterium]|nr:hypothetical protein [Candidatus Acidoferrales bacterium]
MATQTLPYVVPFPQTVPEVEAISQNELVLLLSLRGRLKQLQEEIATEEESLKTRLESGAEIEPGDHTATLKENSRRSVGWKDVAIRLANRLKLDGEMYCARVLAATKPTKIVSLEIH